MTRSDYFRPVRGGISGLCEEADDKSIWTSTLIVNNFNVQLNLTNAVKIAARLFLRYRKNSHCQEENEDDETRFSPFPGSSL